jgi:signal transduction histidine kinase
MESTNRLVTRYRTAALLTVLVATILGIVAEYGGWSSAVPGSAIRILTYSVIGLTAGYQLIHRRRTETVLGVSAIAIAILSLTEAGHMTAFDSGNSLSTLILISVVYITTRDDQSVTPLIVGSLFISIYTVVSIFLERPPVSEAVGKLMVGIPGQILVVWITWRLIQSLAEASRHEANAARIQEALATCSQALLTGGDEEPLSAALNALLDATEADYVYIDVNRVDAEGNVTWEIVADAVGDDAPPGPGAFDEGDYGQCPQIVDLLSSGQPARIQVSTLPMPVRACYEAEGVQSELMAPIMIRDQWVGTLGYSDFWRDDAWTDVEVKGLMRAADMVGAYWERESAREGLEELAKAKDRFIATVSHELRTPLAAVVGFAGELAQGLDRYSRDEIFEMVSLISSQSIEVAQLVDDLLTAERAASGNLTVKPATIDLLDESRSVVGLLRAGPEVTVDGEPTTAWADTLRTRQVVRNLLTNASRYGGRVVRIEVSTRGDAALLVVSDDGQGVNGIDAEHIFDPYYRSPSDDTRPDSVGLGLAVARQLARVMGGDLVYRRQDGWTRFELTLPTAPRHAPALVG